MIDWLFYWFKYYFLKKKEKKSNKESPCWCDAPPCKIKDEQVEKEFKRLKEMSQSGVTTYELQNAFNNSSDNFN